MIGSYPKTTPGVRMTRQCEYIRRRFQPLEPFRETVTQEALDRNPVRFAGLMDVYGPFPFGKNDRRSPLPSGETIVGTRARARPIGHVSLVRTAASMRFLDWPNPWGE